MNGVYNSSLIKDYSTYDPRVLHYLFLVRDFGKKSHVIDSSKCFLTSYALVVMALLFLQIGLGDKPIIPIATDPKLVRAAKEGENKSLQLIHLQDDYEYVHVNGWESADKTSAPEELFHKFLVFYGYTFDFKNNFIDAQDGHIGPKSELPPGISRVYSVIRDPFLRDFNVTERVPAQTAKIIIFTFRSKAHEIAP